MKLLFTLLLICCVYFTGTLAQPRWYVNQETGSDDFNEAQFNDPAHPFKTIQFVIAVSAQRGETNAFITTQGGVWTPFDIMGVNVAIQGDESVFVTPFIDSTATRTAGLTLLGATVIHVQPQMLIGMKNFTCVDTNFQLAYSIDVEDAWWTSTRSTYIYNNYLPLGFGFNTTSPAFSQLVVARNHTAVEFVRDVFLFYDGFVADSQGVTLFTTLDTGNILTDGTVWGWEFGYKLPTKRAIIAESYRSLTNCQPDIPQTCGQQRHTSFIVGWNLDTNDIEEIIYAKGHDASIQFHTLSVRRLDELLRVETKHILHQITGRSILVATDVDTSGKLQIDWFSNPLLDIQFSAIQSRGSLRLAGGLATSVREVYACGSNNVAKSNADDSTIIVNNCPSQSKLQLTLDAAYQGHEMTIIKDNVGQLELVAASGTKIKNASKWNMNVLINSVRIQFHKGNWYILSLF